MNEESSSDLEIPFLEPTSPVAMRRIQEMTGMSRRELDRLPIGAIRLDRIGTILQYNAAEAQLASRSREEVLGKNFFTEVAPCTNVQEFAGRFRDNVGSNRPAVAFPYEFKFPGKSMKVMVLMHFEVDTDCGWVFVRTIG
jgi:photoactive yellow protein